MDPLSTSPLQGVLYMANNSPYARMVRIVIKMHPELNERIKIVAEDISSPDKKSAELMINNPKGKVPKLDWEGITIIDSKRILMFLAGVLKNPNLMLKNDSEETAFETSRSIMDTSKDNFYERRKDPVSEDNIKKNNQTLTEKVQSLNLEYGQLKTTKTITTAAATTLVAISIICALDYAKNRGLFDWTQIPNIEHLHELHQPLSKLPAFVDTVPEIVIPAVPTR